MNRRTLNRLAAVVLAGMLLAAPAQAQVDNAGFVYVGPIGDHGWTYRHDVRRLAVERELGVATTFVESVSEGADAERVIRKLAAGGADIFLLTPDPGAKPGMRVK